MDKKEITRICNEYNDSRHYASTFTGSKDLGQMTEVLRLVQKNIPSLQAQLISLWKIELQQLSGFAYLKQVIAVLPKAAVRLVGIKHNLQKKTTTFSLSFNLAGIKKPGISIQGIPVISFGVHLSVSGNLPAGRGKMKVLKNNFGPEKFTPLKKAS